MPPLLRKIAIFACLSLTDLLLTWQLLQGQQSLAYEGNPIARWFLGAFGWGGLACFKSAMVFLTCGLVVTISRWRSRTAERLMTFSCCLLGLVVFYSGSLVVTGRHIEQLEIQPPPPEWAEEARQNLAHVKMVDGLCQDLIVGRRNLHEAIEVFAASPRGKNPAWRRRLQRLYHCDTSQQCLGSYLVLHTAAFCKTAYPSQLQSVARRMTSALRVECGDVPPYVFKNLPPELQ
jgi:hypothetical protein